MVMEICLAALPPDPKMSNVQTSLESHTLQGFGWVFGRVLIGFLVHRFQLGSGSIQLPGPLEAGVGGLHPPPQ